MPLLLLMCCCCVACAGQEHVDEVIHRDINRTFPEHPMFSDNEGQQRLFRLLKAYAVADPEVGYCQGMAFSAGILLMYMPEEPAFRWVGRSGGRPGYAAGCDG